MFSKCLKSCRKLRYAILGGFFLSLGGGIAIQLVLVLLDSSMHSWTIESSLLSVSKQDQQQLQSIRLTLLEQIPYISADQVYEDLLLEIKNMIQVQKDDNNNTNHPADPSSSSSSSSRSMTVVQWNGMEVGMHNAKQCLAGADAGLIMHCVEPSPTSFQRVQKQLKTATNVTKKNIYLYNEAASSISGMKITFQGSGGTGDHVGQFNVWNMKAGVADDDKLRSKQGETIQVPTIRLDDIIQKQILQSSSSSSSSDDSIDSSTILKNQSTSSHGNRVKNSFFIVKVDTQGYEPAVFDGLLNSIRHHSVQFVLMEYWPKGVDLLLNVLDEDSNNNNINNNNINNNNNSKEPSRHCRAITSILKDILLPAGYLLYALPILSHPGSPPSAKASLIDFMEKSVWKVLPEYQRSYASLANVPRQSIEPLPTHDLYEYCMWFYKLDHQFSSTANSSNNKVYKMGYWSDILAVSPTVLVSTHPHKRKRQGTMNFEDDVNFVLSNPITSTGRVLYNDLMALSS